jgi:hypothetical protein
MQVYAYVPSHLRDPAVQLSGVREVFVTVNFNVKTASFAPAPSTCTPMAPAGPFGDAPPGAHDHSLMPQELDEASEAPSAGT